MDSGEQAVPLETEAVDTEVGDDVLEDLFDGGAVCSELGKALAFLTSSPGAPLT